MLKKEKCINFQKGNINCETCIANKFYIDLQNSNAKSCFKAKQVNIENQVK